MLKKPTKFEIDVIIQKLKEEAINLNFAEIASLVDVLDVLIGRGRGTKWRTEMLNENIIKIKEKL